ncbi:female-specific histamine-binding protein 2-like [Amblyomma americanum]
MLLLLVALCSLLQSFCCEAASPNLLLWQKRTGLEPFQNAWRSLNAAPGTEYVLYQATYRHDNYSWGQDFKCLTVKTISVDKTHKCVTSNFTFQNATPGIHSVIEKIKAVRTNGSRTPNAFQYELGDGRSVTDNVIYTDRVCDLLNIPYKQNGKGCELWVRKSFVNKVPKCCLFLFKIMCANSSHLLYKPEECGDAQKPTNQLGQN